MIDKLKHFMLGGSQSQETTLTHHPPTDTSPPLIHHPLPRRGGGLGVGMGVNISLSQRGLMYQSQSKLL